MMSRGLLRLGLITGAAVICLGLEDGPGSAGVAEPAIRLATAWIRVEPATDAPARVRLTLTAERDAVLLAVETGCRCVAPEVTMPLPLPAHTAVDLPLRVSGLLPGIKTLTLRTTAGPVTATVQIIGPGAGAGLDTLTAALRTAQEQRWSAWILVHDLEGERRNCGCGPGSLGGMEHLAALPALGRALAPGVPLTWALTGDAEGNHPGITDGLVARGWLLAPAAIVVTADVAAALARPEVLAVIPRGGNAPNHRTVLVPPPAGGLAALVLLLDDQGGIREQRVIPIDRTLPSDPTVLAGLPAEDPVTVVRGAVPSAACQACHAAAHATWSTSAHALAWDHLPGTDRTTACAACHTTAIPTEAGQPRRLAGGVHCQACHAGADAHARAPATISTLGAADCRHCHDARHDPGFDRPAAWERIRHAR